MKYRTNEELREEVLNEIPVWSPNKVTKQNLGDLLNKFSQKFIEKKIQAFPMWCQQTRAINAQMRKDMYNYGYKGKYLTNSANENNYGFSKDRSFYHKWVVPKELLFFMRNCIYENFWDDSNAKVRDSFMKAILRGNKDPMQLLGEVRAHYGKAKFQ